MATVLGITEGRAVKIRMGGQPKVRKFACWLHRVAVSLVGQHRCRERLHGAIFLRRVSILWWLSVFSWRFSCTICWKGRTFGTWVISSTSIEVSSSVCSPPRFPSPTESFISARQVKLLRFDRTKETFGELKDGLLGRYKDEGWPKVKIVTVRGLLGSVTLQQKIIWTFYLLRIHRLFVF